MDTKPIYDPHLNTDEENQVNQKSNENEKDVHIGKERNLENTNIMTGKVKINREDPLDFYPDNSMKASKTTTESVGLTKAHTAPEEHGVHDEDVTVLINHKLQTISQYMSLVENKKNHVMLLQESTITGFLVLCLGDDIPEVVEKSFEVFRSLSKHDDNLPIIKKLDYIMDALRCVASNSVLKETIRRDAKNLISDLQTSSQKNHAPLVELSNSAKNIMGAVTTKVSSMSIVEDAKESVKNSTDLNTTMSTMKRKNKGRETILFLENDVIQSKMERVKITQVLIGVPGIISVTYDLKKNLCIVRGKRQVLSEVFGRAVAALGLANVYLIRKNENKEDVKTLISATDKENVVYPLPAYPEEQENDEIDDSAAVAKVDQLPADDASFLKSAKNFIKRSFYW